MLIGLIGQLAQLAIIRYPLRIIRMLFRLPRPFLRAQDCLSTPKAYRVLKLYSLSVLISSYLAHSSADKDRLKNPRV